MRIPEPLRDCVAFIYCEDAQKQKRRLGTAFFVGYSIENLKRGPCYTVTAQHIIAPLRNWTKNDGGKMLLRLNTLDEKSEYVELNIDDWIDHPLGSDVSVLAWIPPADKYMYQVYPTNSLITEEIAIRENIGAGDEVFIIGLFHSHMGKDKNLPIVRTGHIALMPEEKVRTKNHGDVEAFLIETHSIGGLSGSPVFVHLYGIRRESDEKVTLSRYTTIYLLGLINGHYDELVSKTDEFMEDLTGEGSVNAGIAIVIPATHIQETLDRPDLVAMREEWLKQMQDGNGHPNEDILD